MNEEEPAHEVQCPQRGCTIRARMADGDDLAHELARAWAERGPGEVELPGRVHAALDRLATRLLRPAPTTEETP